MQVPPTVPSLPDSPQPVGAKRAAAPLRALGWWLFAFVLTGFLIALAITPERRHSITPAVLVTLCFAALAWAIRGVTLDGAAAGFLVTAVLFIAGGPAMFGAVLTVFIVTHLATKLGRGRKQALAISERSTGRDAAQVLANLGIAALMAALAQLTGWHQLFFTASVAALAEAACDTVSSEAGKALARAPRLIISWKQVVAGTDGAISLPGTVLGIATAAVVVVEATATHVLRPGVAATAVTAAILGMLLDSLLGATMEARGHLSNNAVNLVSTAFSAALAALVNSHRG